MRLAAKLRARRGRCPLCGKTPILVRMDDKYEYMCVRHCGVQASTMREAYARWLQLVSDLADM